MLEHADGNDAVVSSLRKRSVAMITQQNTDLAL